MNAVTSLMYPDGETLSSNYDSKGFLRSTYFGTVSNSDPVSFLVGQVSYTNSGQLAGFAIGGTAAKTSVPTTPIFSTMLGYDDIQRLITSSATLGGTSTPFWSQSRTLDNVGNVLQLSTTVPTTSGSSLTDNQSFCYDALGRLMWAGNSGTPSGGDHCGSTPGGSTTSGYTQSFSYDAIDRMLVGSAGTESYGDASHVHAATDLSSIPNQYASYDAMGNMVCRNTDSSGSQSCASGTQTGATMSYDNEGRLTTWTAPAGTTGSDQFLYDAAGNRVLQRRSSTSAGSSTPTITDTITFDGYTDTTISNGTTTTTKYYQAGGQTVASATGTAWSYLVPDLLKNTTLALKGDGTVQAVQLYAPYGSMRYTDGTIPTPSNFTGQRLDTQTGLLYYNSRYYDAVSGRFTSTDTVQTNAQGADTYAYVNDNPIGRTDPTGHCPWCIVGAAIGALVGAGIDYGAQVYNNYQNGDSNPWTDVNWWDVGGAALAGGLVGLTMGAAAPAVAAAFTAGVTAVNAGVGLSGAATLAYTAFQYGPDLGNDVAAVASDTEPATVSENTSTSFHTVQSAADRTRLQGGGEPWPTGTTNGAVRAIFGPGVYSWENEDSAGSYLALKTDPSYDTKVVSFSIDNAKLAGFKTVDLSTMSDDDANAWLSEHSTSGKGIPDPGVEHVIQSSWKYGLQHYFSPSVMKSINWEWPGK